MQIQIQKEGTSCTLTLSGRLDTITAPELEQTLDAHIGDVTELIFDLQDLTYTSSAGLRIFLKAQKQMNRQGSMKLLHVCPDVLEIFAITGFTEFLTIE